MVTTQKIILCLATFLVPNVVNADDYLFKSLKYGAPEATFSAAKYPKCPDGNGRCVSDFNFLGYKFKKSLSFDDGRLKSVTLKSHELTKEEIEIIFNAFSQNDFSPCTASGILDSVSIDAPKRMAQLRQKNYVPKEYRSSTVRKEILSLVENNRAKGALVIWLEDMSFQNGCPLALSIQKKRVASFFFGSDEVVIQLSFFKPIPIYEKF